MYRNFSASGATPCTIATPATGVTRGGSPPALHGWVRRRRGVAAVCGERACYLAYVGGDGGGGGDAAGVLYGGGVGATQFKHHLPNYGVFDERRYFKPGQSLDILRRKSTRLNSIHLG